MAINLLNMLKDEISDATLSQAGSFLGAESSGVKSAMGIALPSILGSMIASGSTAEGSKRLIDMITNGEHDGSVFDNLGRVLGGGDTTSDFLNSGSSILKYLIGNKLGSVIDIISSVSGLSKGSSSSIMSMAAPLVMGMVGKYLKNKSLDAMGFSNFLGSQIQYVADAIPAGMGTLLGFSELNAPAMGDKVEAAAEAARETVAEANGDNSSLLKKIISVVLVLAIVYFGWSWMSGNSVSDAVADAGDKISETAKGTGDMVNDATANVGDKISDAAKSAGEIASDVADVITEGAKKTMKGVTFSAGSVGEKFSDFLESDRTGDGTFQFINLIFPSGSAAIQDMSEVNNLAKVLNAYSDINIEVGGHTDSSGAADKNIVLSQTRAEAVKTQLVAQGVAENRITAKGYGSTAPTTENAADASNRRVEIKILK